MLAVIEENVTSFNNHQNGAKGSTTTSTADNFPSLQKSPNQVGITSVSHLVGSRWMVCDDFLVINFECCVDYRENVR